MHKTFQYSVEGEYLALLSDGDYATLPSEKDMLICAITREYICQFDMALYPKEKKFPCVLYTLFVNDVEWIKMNCNCEGKPQNP